MKTMLILTFIIVALVVSGCEHIPSARQDTLLNRNFGRSHETAIYNQILDPDAGKNLDPVEGLDGRYVETNMNTYQKGNEKEKKNVLKLETGIK
jgi:hypothetical protein